MNIVLEGFNLMAAEQWITDGRSLLGLKENSAGWLAMLYRDGAKKVEVDVSDGVEEITAMKIVLPDRPLAQKKLLVSLAACCPAHSAKLDENDPNTVWLFLD